LKQGTATIPERFANASLESFRVPVGKVNVLKPVLNAIREYVSTFPHLPGTGILFVGPPGVGKTHLAVAVFKEVLRQGHEGMYCDCRTLLDSAIREWKWSESVPVGMYETALDIPVLLLDDLGADAVSIGRKI